MKGREGPVPKTFVQNGRERISDRIQRLKESLDVEYIIFVMYGGLTEHRLMPRSVRLFGEKAIPKYADGKTPEPELANAKVSAAVSG
jgi:hypothetical protein